jgi:hypothetical protein
LRSTTARSQAANAGNNEACDRVLSHRERGDAHAVVGHERREAVDLDDAIGMAQALSLTLAMPQRPDWMSMADWMATLFIQPSWLPPIQKIR